MALLRNSAIVLAVNWVMVPLGILSGVVVARVLGPEGKGALLVLSAVAALLVAAFGFGLPTAAAFELRTRRESPGSVAGAAAALSLAATLLAVVAFASLSTSVLHAFLGTATEDVSRQWLWLVLLSLFPALLSTVSDALLIVDGDIRRYAWKNAWSGIATPVLTIAFVALLGWGVAGALWAQVIALACACAVAASWLRSKGERGRLSFSLSQTAGMLQVGIQQYALSLVAMVAKRVDAFLIAGLLTVREAGIFSVAYAILNLLNTVSKSAMWPMVGRLTAHGGGEDIGYLAAATRLQFAGMIGFSVLAAAAAPWVVVGLYGPAFAEAVIPVWAILPAAALGSLAVAANAYFATIGRMRSLVAAATVATIAQVVTAVVLLPRIGVVGSAIAFTVNQAVVGLWSLVLLARRTNMSPADYLLPRNTDLQMVRRAAAGALRRTAR